MTNIKTGAEIFWETLIQEGVDVVFGYPGAATLPIYGAMDTYHGQIRHILTRHEQGATHMADGYARAGGNVGVAMATSGPGATNMVGAINQAMQDASPIVCITGQVSSSSIGTDAFQEVDMIDITLPITKHNYLVESVDELADTIREAFYIAHTGRPGPVLIDIPKNIQTETMAFDMPTAPVYIRGYDAEPSGAWTQTAQNIIHHNLSMAIGASFYLKDEALWVVVDADSAEMAVPELATMVQENTNIKVIVVGNPSTLSGPNYFKLAQAYGMPGYRIKHTGDFFPVVHLAQAQHGPALIESNIEIYDLYAMLSAHPVLHQIFQRSFTRFKKGAVVNTPELAAIS